MSDFHPELSGYEPTDSSRPLRGRRMVLLMRITVILGLVALLVPGVLTTMSIASATAARACAAAVTRYYPLSEGIDARFELVGAGGFGWQCYAIDQNERQTFVIPLGIIPGPFRPPAAGVTT
ncbi:MULTISPECIES: hypothetical protein [Cryobacterium]|uniref:hypothetical protein n=1 Tax=Cryobacterium TaxID=69578 RepID=UPI000CD3F91B|nr:MULTISPECIES: hypothetical protein [Cryobacterium]POH66192.1 hypothetical protein C3B60_10360 [Cryobacterium zongtaii]TFC46865.1 hypothetical protein E3O57_06500 [Cryobacterium sp. TMN-39-2]